MNRRRTTITGFMVAVAILMLATNVVAQGRGPASPAPPGDVSLQDTLTSVDLSARTITLGDETYRVADDVRLVDEAGARIRLRTLAATGAGREVLFRAREARGDRNRGRADLRVLVSLALIEGDFE